MDYTGGTAFTGVVGPEHGISRCWMSIISMDRRPGDSPPLFIFATKGYEGRQIVINSFLESEHDWLLMLDHDMLFPADTLERLRSHNQPYVSGYYVRRNLSRPYPVWYELPDNPNAVPTRPFLETPERGRLHPIGASGWGCILIHRSVIEDTRPLLKGEWEVLEDDMDVWPYDPAEIQCLIDQTEQAVLALNDVDALGTLQVLKEKFRPLRGSNKVPIGSDIRFPFFARQAGYTLYGDPDVVCAHMIDLPLNPRDWEGIPEPRLSRLKGEIYTELAELERGYAEAA